MRKNHQEDADSNPLNHFMQNIDGRDALTAFKSACNAIAQHDKAIVAKDDIKAETWRNIFSSECMRLCREYEHAPEIRAALTSTTTKVQLNSAKYFSYPVTADIEERKRSERKTFLVLEECCPLCGDNLIHNSRVECGALNCTYDEGKKHE